MSYNESLSANSNYPTMSQSDWDRAPWNQEDPKPKSIQVTISVTLSKTVDIEVDDYDIDAEGYYDYSNCDLLKAVEAQIIMPQDAYNVIKGTSLDVKRNQDLKDWNIDDFEVMLDE